jgi:hypothetical protein
VIGAPARAAVSVATGQQPIRRRHISTISGETTMPITRILTTSPRRQTLTAALCATLVALILTVALPTQAQAWQVHQTCSGESTPTSCVWYDREGQTVGRLLGGVRLAPFSSRTGFIQIWTSDGKFNWRSATKTYTNGPTTKTFYDGVNYYTWTAPNTAICARWHDSRLGPRLPACWTTPLA